VGGLKVGGLKVGGGVGIFDSVSNVTFAVGEDEGDIVGESVGKSVGIVKLELGERDAVYSSSQPSKLSSSSCWLTEGTCALDPFEEV
jgi:hypothetical protein